MIYFKKLLPVLILFAFQFNAQSQIGNTAPDFTAIDTHGETHTLYDYLEDGKVVVLDFFFTTCGPCQFYSPQVNLAYEKYGCNTADVIFMAIDWGDTNDEVIAYDAEYQIEYPSISGTEGGGNGIVNLYGVTGFPTFYVIDSTKKIIDQIDPPTLQVFDFRFAQHGISPAECGVTSVSPLTYMNYISLFPNPVSGGILNVSLPGSLNEAADILIYDSFGKLIEKKQLSTVRNYLQIPVDALSPGIYFLKIEGLESGKIYSEKFVKI
jgi:thiol-disulfide isomerase/thioredoxin